MVNASEVSQDELARYYEALGPIRDLVLVDHDFGQAVIEHQVADWSQRFVIASELVLRNLGRVDHLSHNPPNRDSRTAGLSRQCNGECRQSLRPGERQEGADRPTGAGHGFGGGLQGGARGADIIDQRQPLRWPLGRRPAKGANHVGPALRLPQANLGGCGPHTAQASQHWQLEHQAETAGQPFSLIEASLALSGGVQWNERQHGDPYAGLADGGFEAPRQGGGQLRPRPVLVDMNRALQWTL